MNDFSPNLGLPYLMPAQAQKHVTVNESLRALDALVQMSVVTRSRTDQPGDPEDGAGYILPPGKTGADWGPMADHAIACYRDGAWAQLRPAPGWRAWIADEASLAFHNGQEWTSLSAKLAEKADSGHDVTALQSGDGYQQTPAGVSAFEMGVADGVWPLEFSAGLTVRHSVNRQFQLSAGTSGLVFRRGHTSEAGGAGEGWAPWRAVWHEDNFDPDALNPSQDAAYSLGAPGAAWDDLYLAGSVISASDARLKSVRGPLADAERAVARRLLEQIRLYRFKSAEAEKGEGARLHCGLMAQDVAAAFTAEGLEARDYALFCEDENGGEARQGLRYSELILFLLPALAEAA